MYYLEGLEGLFSKKNAKKINIIIIMGEENKQI